MQSCSGAGGRPDVLKGTVAVPITQGREKLSTTCAEKVVALRIRDGHRVSAKHCHQRPRQGP
jgi:hypothetical protein